MERNSQRNVTNTSPSAAAKAGREQRKEFMVTNSWKQQGVLIRIQHRGDRGYKVAYNLCKTQKSICCTPKEIKVQIARCGLYMKNVRESEKNRSISISGPSATHKGPEGLFQLIKERPLAFGFLRLRGSFNRVWAYGWIALNFHTALDFGLFESLNNGRLSREW